MMAKRRLLLKGVMGLFSLLLLASCANIVPPEGGPRDQRPPQILGSEPPTRSVNFTAPTIRIYFDEFVELKDIANQLFVSPPLEENPEVRVKGRSIMVILPDSLNPNTTYTLYFGDAVRDITEGNVVADLTYSFSTGPVIDSLIIKGYVADAYTNEAIDNALICVYKGHEDSLFSTQRPDYITRSNEKGEFTVYNLPGQEFRVYALSDNNNNFFYDLPNEVIGFDTNLYMPFAPLVSKPDTIADSLGTSIPDSLRVEEVAVDSMEAEEPPPGPYLKMFTDLDTSQRLLSAGLAAPSHLQFIFRHPVKEFEVEPIDTAFAGEWFIYEGGSVPDTVDLWLTQETGDSLILELRDGLRLLDTAEFQMKSRSISRSGGKRGNTTAKSNSASFKPACNAKGSFNLYADLLITSAYPIRAFDTSLMLFQGGGDTSSPSVSFKDDASRFLHIDKKLKQGTDYQLILDDSALVNILGAYSDSVSFKFKTLKNEDLGILRFELSGISGNNWIAELINSKDAVGRRIRNCGAGELLFDALPAGKYRLRLYHDLNNNGRWDAGFFKARMQAEPVYYYPGEVNVRANWELNEPWEVKP